MLNLITVFESIVRQTPQKSFIRFQNESITYEQMLDLSFRAASVLHHLGVQKNDRVALMCFNTPGFICAMLGAWRLGAAIVPINHQLQAAEVDYILQHSEAKAILFDSTLSPVLDAVAHNAQRIYTENPLSTLPALAGVPHFENLLEQTVSHTDIMDEAMRKAVPTLIPDDHSVAQVLYTSGTTGQPKGCIHTHQSVTLAAMNIALNMGIESSERTLIAMPIWDASSLNNWFASTLYVGGCIVLQREYHPQQFLELLQNERITLFFGTPEAFSMPIELVPEFEAYDLSSVRFWIYGGNSSNADLTKKWIQKYKSDHFYQVYGMSETNVLGSILYPEEQQNHAGSIGCRAMIGVDWRVVNKNAQDIQAGEMGEIWLRSSSIMQNYLNNPSATQAAFSSDGWYKTGDVARMDKDGYLYVVDRLKDLIITGKETVYSKEVEDALKQHPAIADAAVVGRAHVEWGEIVVAHVVAKDITKTRPQSASLRAFLSTQLTHYQIPREFIWVDHLPRTSTGKLQKFLLKHVK